MVIDSLCVQNFYICTISETNIASTYSEGTLCTIVKERSMQYLEVPGRI